MLFCVVVMQQTVHRGLCIVSVKELGSWALRLPHLFVHLDRSCYHSMNGLSSLDETYREYALAPTDDLIRFGRSMDEVTAGHRGGDW